MFEQCLYGVNVQLLSIFVLHFQANEEIECPFLSIYAHVMRIS